MDWNRLQFLARQHKVRPLLYKGLLKSDSLDALPKVYLSKLKKEVFQLSLRNLNQAKELIRLVKLFRKESIEIIPLKGLVLSHLIFNDLHSRESIDIDFLIRLEDYPKLKNLLLGEDYQQVKIIPKVLEKQFQYFNCEYLFCLKQDGQEVLHIEPHWFIGHRMYQLNFDYLKVEKLTNRTNWLNCSMNKLSPEGALLTTCLHHGGKDQWNSLKTICDIGGLLNKYEGQLDWDLLMTTADKWKVRHLFLMGVGIAAKFFDIPIPLKINQLNQKKNIKKLIDNAIINLQGVPNQEISVDNFMNRLSFHLSLRAKLSTKLKILFYHILQLILPSLEDIKNENASKWEYWRFVCKKPFRLWKTYFKI